LANSNWTYCELEAPTSSTLEDDATARAPSWAALLPHNVVLAISDSLQSRPRIRTPADLVHPPAYASLIFVRTPSWHNPQHNFSSLRSLSPPPRSLAVVSPTDTLCLRASLCSVLPFGHWKGSSWGSHLCPPHSDFAGAAPR